MTNVQKQCLLVFLGYDTGGVDGIWGAKSRQAVECAQEDLGIGVDGVWGPQTEAAVLEAVWTWDDNGTSTPNNGTSTLNNGTNETQAEQLTALFEGIRYWSPEEFRCRCGNYHEPYCDGWPALPDRELLELADDIRELTGVAHSTSGLRCYQHNIDSDGASGSRHKTGKALDFWVEGYTSAQLLRVVQLDKRVRYAYAVDDKIVHMDVR